MVRARETAGLILDQMPEVDRSSVKFTDLLTEGAPHQVDPPRSHYQTDRYQRYLFEQGSRIESAFRNYIHRGHEMEKNETAVIVCHANVIRYFVMRAMQCDPSAWLRIRLKGPTGTVIKTL